MLAPGLLSELTVAAVKPSKLPQVEAARANSHIRLIAPTACSPTFQVTKVAVTGKINITATANTMCKVPLNVCVRSCVTNFGEHRVGTPPNSTFPAIVLVWAGAAAKDARILQAIQKNAKAMMLLVIDRLDDYPKASQAFRKFTVSRHDAEKSRSFRSLTDGPASKDRDDGQIAA
jgi:hypothetical protein